MDTIVWSAGACDYPGAGVYIGLAPDYEHMAVGRGLAARQARLFVGGRMRLKPGERPCSFHYYAVRDPSAVRVVRLPRPAVPEGFRHVELRIQINRDSHGETVVVQAPESGAPGSDGHHQRIPHAGFLLTIGMPIEREAAFFHRIIGAGPDQDWADVYERLRQNGCAAAEESEKHPARRRAAP
jgi:hypothetical protein